MNQTFSVIQTINTQYNLLVRCQHFRRLLRQLDEPFEWNTNRKWSHAHRTSAMFDQQVLAVDTTTQVSLATVDEVEAIVHDVEADHVAAQHALEDFVGPREQAEYVPWGEGNVEEEAQLAGYSLLFCCLE